jgi:NAD(P)-dependent dehydrogenase (short-subunit alcohol dehydrogenase family)
LSSFAHGKWALRAMVQSVAREFAPQGIHVAHAIIDGVIDIPRTKAWLQGQPAEAKIDPDAVSCNWTPSILLVYDHHLQGGVDMIV